MHEQDLKKRTRTNLYNARPARPDNAHKTLDAAVAAAYGWADFFRKPLRPPGDPGQFARKRRSCLRNLFELVQGRRRRPARFLADSYDGLIGVEVDLPIVVGVGVGAY